MLRIVCGQWHYRFQVHGIEYTGSTHVDASGATGRTPSPEWSPRAVKNFEKAQTIEATKRSLVLNGREDELKLKVMPLEKAYIQFSEWAESEYKQHPNSARRIDSSFTSLLEFIGGKTPVHAIRAGKIEDYKAWRRRCPECGGHKPEVESCDFCEATGEGVKDITLRHDLHALSTFMQYAKKQGWCSSNPVRDVDVPSDAGAIRFHVISPEVERAYFSKCLQLCEQDLHDLTRLMLLQGPRPNVEVLAARIEDIDLIKGTWRIHKSKTNAGERTLSLVPDARALLAARIARVAGFSPAGWLFPSPRNKQAHLTALNDEHYRVLAELPSEARCVIYDFRHNFATRCAAAGMPLPHLQVIMGHTSIKTTMRYVHISEQQAAEAMRQYGQQERTIEQVTVRAQ